MKKYIIIFIILAAGSLSLLVYKYQYNNFITNAPKCGGIAGQICPTGYECTGIENYPDAQGYCVKI